MTLCLSEDVKSKSARELDSLRRGEGRRAERSVELNIEGRKAKEERLTSHPLTPQDANRRSIRIMDEIEHQEKQRRR